MIPGASLSQLSFCRAALHEASRLDFRIPAHSDSRPQSCWDVVPTVLSQDLSPTGVEGVG